MAKSQQTKIEHPIHHLQKQLAKKSGLAAQLEPQLQLMVVLGEQYAALAKLVNGRKAMICAELRAVMLCLFENSATSWGAGTASTNVSAHITTARIEFFENIF